MLPIHFLLLKSYLDERHFFLRYGEDTSDLQEIISGIPQGSVLGPIKHYAYCLRLTC